MATTSVRRAAMAALLDAFRAADPYLLVASGWPGDRNLRDRMLWVDEVRSDSEVPTVKADRLQRDDRFVIVLLGRVAGDRTTDAAHDRLEAIDAVIDDVVADDHTLDGLDGVVSVVVTEASFTVGTYPEGVVGYMRREVLVHSRLL